MLQRIKSALSSKSLLSLGWFLFIAVLLGQLGPILSIFNAWWDGKDALSELNRQARQGNFIIFAPSLLATSAYFLIRDYAQKNQISNKHRKLKLLLVAAALGLIDSVIALKLIQNPVFVSCAQEAFHWLAFLASILTSISFWRLEEEESGIVVINEINENTEQLTHDSAQKTSTSDGYTL
ncbi:hypothetical protein NA643_13430 [Pseudomonas stutzeri]|uniref:hypothetical protein n=1 Tax=Stutzerimonas stutzeri TaxID=316 RepID=UPI00210BFFA2|nr:hypothetical protein [Stutzerimonas stutzeri]MCQ4280090.1 hypothetical protein [Stutzerimonas stutzeri]